MLDHVVRSPIASSPIASSPIVVSLLMSHVTRGELTTGGVRGVAQLRRGSVLRGHGRRRHSCGRGVRGARLRALDGSGPGLAPRHFSV